MSKSIEKNDQAPLAKLGSRSRWRAYILVSITLAGLLICFLLAAPFLPALTWSIALAILFAPSHRILADKLKSPNLAAFISVFWIGLIIIIPAALLGGRLIAEAAKGANTMKEKAMSEEWRRAMEDQSALRPIVEWIDQINIPDAIGNVASWLATASASLVRGGLLQLVTVH